MSTKLKKASAVGLALTTAAWLSGASLVIPLASAATVAELQAQIAALLAQITQLQGQLQTGSAAAVSSVPSITRNLTVGSRGADVSALQQYLIDEGHLTAVSVPTSYFGSATRAAVAAWQKEVGLTPPAGYFGPKSRAYLASLAAQAPTGPVAPTTPVTPTGPTTPTGPVAPASGLAVSLASDNPGAGSLISSSGSAAARVEVLKVALTAGNAGAVKVTGLKFKKTGVVSDTAISSAYLVEGGKVLTQFSSISQGVITFSGLDLSVDAAKTRTFTLAVDPSTGLTAGNTIAFAMNAAADVTAQDTAGTAVTPSGSFPLSGNIFNVTSVSNPSLATLTFASSSVGTTVYAGTTGVLVSQWTLTAANSPVKIKSIKYTVVGSAAKTDIKNVMLKINGTQVGTTLSGVGSDGAAFFDLSANPPLARTGSSNLQVYADVLGSPSFNFDFGILNTYDVLAEDSNYNTNVSVTVNGGGTGSTSGHQITINQGSITVNAASDTPTGNVAAGSSGVTLGKFNIFAAGEPVKVRYLDATLTFSASVQATTSVQNVYLVDDQGIQIGSTINTVVAGTSSGQCTGTPPTTAYVCHFGTSGSNINYIVPANTTRVISVKSDILSTATGWTTVTASLPAMTGGNLQGQTSSQTANSGSASGGALTLAANALRSAQNTAHGARTYAVGAVNVKIGSYVLTASAAEGVNIANLTITTSASSTNFQNLLVKVGETQFGTTQPTLSASQAVTFSGATSINVPAGGSKTVDVYANVLSSAATGLLTTVTTLSSCTGTGVSTFASISCPSSISGQNVTISSGPTLAVAMSSQTAATKQVVMGSTNNSFATFRFTETANVEGVKLQTVVISATSTGSNGTISGFENLKLYNGSTVVAGPVSASSTASNVWVYEFNFSTPQVVVPQNGSLELEVKGDVATVSSAGAVSNKAYTFRIASSTTDITAFGQSSNTSLTTANKTLNSTVGNAVTVLQSKLTLTASTLGSASGRVRTAVDDVANIIFAADSSFDVTVNTVTLRFNGIAVSTGTAITANLIDPLTGTDWSGLSSAGATCTTTVNSCSLSFSFSTIPTLSRGASKTVKLRLNSASFFNAAQTSDSVSILVNGASDVNWGDGSTTNGLSLEATAVPLTVTTVSYE